MPPEPIPLHDKYKLPPGTFPLKIQKKVNDKEGLGARIPIENIGALAGNIGAAALSGGATVAGEALITGGVAGLMGAGEAILGATIGSGVATGISTALGNSTAGHLISGVAGGVIGRTAGRRVANRLRNRDNQNQELQPLLSSNTGTRLVGRQGRNRITEPQSQVLHDPQTGEISTWQIPPEQSQPSILNRTVQSLRNRAQNISDGIQNIRQQITGRITNTGRGRYSRVSTNEPIEQHEPMSASAPMSASEPPIINVTDEIMPLLNRSATRIQRLNRAIRQRRTTAERRYQEQISREFDENMTRTRNEERQRNQDAINELDQILRQDALQQSSATRIQSAVRNRNATNETIKRAKEKQQTTLQQQFKAQ